MATIEELKNSLAVMAGRLQNISIQIGAIVEEGVQEIGLVATIFEGSTRDEPIQLQEKLLLFIEKLEEAHTTVDEYVALADQFSNSL